MSRKNLWLITCSYGSYTDSQTIRLRHLLFHLDQAAYAMTVLAPGPEISRLAVREGVNHHFTKPPFVFRFLKSIASIPFAGRKLEWLFRNIFYRIGFPDMFMGWHRQLLSSVRKAELDAPDLVISASGSPAAHMAAKRVASKYGVPWIADYGDPWYTIDRKHRPLMAPLTWCVERSLVKKMSVILFTTNATRLEYNQLYGKSMSSMYTFPYGYLRHDMPAASDDNLANDCLTFAHVGTAHKSDRNLLPFIAALDQVGATAQSFNTGMLLAGMYSPDFEKALETAVNIKPKQIFGKVSLDDSIKLQAASNVLVIVGNKNGRQVPGKVFICMAIPRPILYLSQADPATDEAFQYLKNQAGVLVCNNEATEIESAIQLLQNNYAEWLAASWQRVQSDQLLHMEGHLLSKRLQMVMEEML